jgi:hypothetical protein
MSMSAFDEGMRILLGPVVLVFLGFLLFRLVSELIRLSRDEDFPAFESNWGGLGRGLGGWSVNRMMVIGVLALLALFAFGSVSYVLLSKPPVKTGSGTGKKSEESTDTSKPAGTPAANPEPAKAADANPNGTKPATAPPGNAESKRRE